MLENMMEGMRAYHALVERLEKEYEGAESGVVVSNGTRDILHDEKYIYLYLKFGGVLEYLDYTPELYTFLATPGHCYFTLDKSGRVQVELTEYARNGKPRFAPMLSRFAYYYYHAKEPLDVFAWKFAWISARESEAGYQVDHVNNDVHNNCSWNLAAIPGYGPGSNRAKSDYLARIKPPYFCYPVVMPDGSYRVSYGYIAPERDGEELRLRGWESYLICPDAAALCDFLRRFFEMEKAPDGLEAYGTPRERWKRDKRGVYFAGDFGTAEKQYQKLAAMPQIAFQVWNGGER
jgi:hypothetical protein